MNSPFFQEDRLLSENSLIQFSSLLGVEAFRRDIASTGMSELPIDAAWNDVIGELAALYPSVLRRDLALTICSIYAARMSEELQANFPLGILEPSTEGYAFTPCSIMLAPQDRFNDLLNRVRKAADAPADRSGDIGSLLEVQELSYIVTAGAGRDAIAPAQIHLHCHEDGALEVWHANALRAEAAKLIMDRMIALVRGIVARPDTPLVHQPIMSARERQLVVRDWNATDRPYRFDGGLVAMMEKTVQDAPDHPALIFRDATISNAEFNGRVNRLARLLRTHGVGRDQFVCLFMDRGLELLIAIWAILKAGGAYVPLNVEDPASRVSEIVTDCKPKVLLTQEHFRDRIVTDATDVVVVPEGGDIDRSADQRDLGVEINPDDLAYMIYTSGSTGKPKGVVVEHAAIHNRVVWMHEEYGLMPEDRVLQKTPYTFDVSVWEFLWPLSVGSTLVIAEPGGHTVIGYLSGLIRDTGVTHLHFVPSVLRLFLMAPDLELLPIKKLFCSGEALGADIVRSFYEKANAHAEVHNLYGPTEAAVDVSYFACPRGSSDHTVPIGRPVANTGLYILDTFDQPVPVGVPGELHIGGIQLARGYWAREELTAERFVPCPVDDAPHDRLYRTGDRALIRPDGQILYLGRNDFQVKVNGVRIELGEIEAAIREQGGVTDVVVIAEEHAGSKRLIAYVVAAAPSAAEAARLQDGVASTCPANYVPKEVRFIEAMPLSTSGKINRKVLSEQTRLGTEEVARPE